MIGELKERKTSCEVSTLHKEGLTIQNEEIGKYKRKENLNNNRKLSQEVSFMSRSPPFMVTRLLVPLLLLLWGLAGEQGSLLQTATEQGSLLSYLPVLWISIVQILWWTPL